VPSRAESLPYIVLEAAAAGLPMLATNVGGIPEIFGSQAGELLPAGDAASLAAAIRTALDMPLAERQQRHRRMFAHLVRHDVDRWVDDFLAALAESRQRPSLFDGLRRLFEFPRTGTNG